MVISQAAKISRPTPKSILDNNRRSDFSFALANMIQMTQDKESQLLLQTTGKHLKLYVNFAVNFDNFRRYNQTP